MLWFVQTQPTAEILSSDLALINKHGDEMADADGFAQVSAAWKDAVLKHPDDSRVLAHAVFFHSVSDPEAALGIAQQANNWPNRDRWLSYVLSMMASGAQWTKIREQELQFDPASASEAAQDRLLAAKDLGMVLSATWSLPPQERATHFCSQLLTHTRSLFAQTEAHCAAGSAGESVKFKAPKLSVAVEPKIPKFNADSSRSSIEVAIVIDTLGRVTCVGMLKGHPALWAPALLAVQQWTFHPATLNGNAVPVTAVVHLTVPSIP